MMSNHRRHVERNFQRLFPSMHAQAANVWADCLSCHHKLPSFPFLACHSAVFIVGIHINFVKPKRSQMLWVTIIYWQGRRIRETLRRGQWQSPMQVCDRCRPMGRRFLCVVWHGPGMTANLCSWSLWYYGQNAPCWNRLVRRLVNVTNERFVSPLTINPKPYPPNYILACRNSSQKTCNQGICTGRIHSLMAEKEHQSNSPWNPTSSIAYGSIIIKSWNKSFVETFAKCEVIHRNKSNQKQKPNFVETFARYEVIHRNKSNQEQKPNFVETFARCEVIHRNKSNQKQKPNFVETLAKCEVIHRKILMFSNRVTLIHSLLFNPFLTV